MEKIEVDVELGTVKIDGKVVYSEKPLKMDSVEEFVRMFESYEGVKEYSGVVASAQNWYYNKILETPWCTTFLCYIAYQVGIDKQTGKHENVDRLKDFMQARNMVDCTANHGGGHYKAKRGDIVFMSDKFKYQDCTHVGVVTDIDHHTGSVSVISGNCDNSVKIKKYNYITNMYIVAWGRIV